MNNKAIEAVACPCCRREDNLNLVDEHLHGMSECRNCACIWHEDERKQPALWCEDMTQAKTGKLLLLKINTGKRQLVMYGAYNEKNAPFHWCTCEDMDDLLKGGNGWPLKAAIAWRPLPEHKKG